MSMCFKLLRVVLFLGGVACSGAEAATWRVAVEANPGEAGAQRALLTTDEAARPLLLSTVELSTTGVELSETRELAVMPETTSHTVALPRVERDTYFELTVTTDTQAVTTVSLERLAVDAEEEDAAARPVLVWRTVARPPGKKLGAYSGRKEMLPPADFEKYWDCAKRQLAAVAMEPLVTRVPDRDTSTGLLHRVELPSVQDTRIVCWYYVPRDAFGEDGKVAKKYPAILIAPGYGAEEPPLDRTSDGYITLSINPRNHGPSKEFWKAPVDHLVYNIADPETYYYKLAFLDCLRGAQFVFSREEVDGKRVASEGGSQGGLFALAMAALEPRIAAVCSNVTAFSDYPDGMVLATVGHHVKFRELLADADTTTAEKIRRSLAYTDGANMATMVKAPVQFNMGGLDPVCPYVCGIVASNRLPKGVEREVHVVPTARHEVPPVMRANNRRWYERWLKNSK